MTETSRKHTFDEYVEHTKHCQQCTDAWLGKGETLGGHPENGCPDGQEIYNSYKSWNGSR